MTRIEDQARSMDRQLSQDFSSYSGDQLQQMIHTKDVQVAALTLQQTGAIANAGTGSLPAVADEVNRIAVDASTQQDAIRQRSDIVRFFFGGSQGAATSLEQDAARYQAQIDSLDRTLSSPDLNPSLRSLIEDQVRILEQERDRISAIASQERQSRGLFGGLFG